MEMLNSDELFFCSRVCDPRPASVRPATEAGGVPMAETLPSVSTDQVAAFVELADHKSLRAAAAGLHITEQGLRNRLIALETQLKVPLYHKQRGPRRRSPLTPQGEQF